MQQTNEQIDDPEEKSIDCVYVCMDVTCDKIRSLSNAQARLFSVCILFENWKRDQFKRFKLPHANSICARCMYARHTKNKRFFFSVR